MTDLEKMVNALYEFILYELGRCEDEYRDSVNTYYSTKTMPNMISVIIAWVELEYFKRMYRQLMEYIKYFSK